MNENYKNKLILFLSILILCIFLFLLYQKYREHLKKKERENFDFTPSVSPYNSYVPNFIQDFSNGTHNSSPNYKYENITQYNYDKIVERIKKMQHDDIHLKGKTDYLFFTQSTTDDKMRMNLDMITERVLKYLNDDYFHFQKTNYGDVEMHTDKDGNEEIKYELFLWDVKNYFEIKLWVHVIKFIHKNQMKKYGIQKKEYIFPYYNIGMDSKDQMIPSPLDVITTAHFDLSTSSEHPNVPAEIRYFYLNKIEIQNSTLVVDYHKDKFPSNQFQVSDAPNHFSGINDMTIEYANIKTPPDSAPYLERGQKYNEWPTLDEEPKWKKQYPAKSPPLEWDLDGVYYYKKGEKILPDHKCDNYSPGVRWSAQSEPLQPYFWPTLATIPRNCGEYEWLFDLASTLNGNVFVGGGKK